ncbi:MAG: ATP-binding protein [Coprobacillus cateniformis]|uniref:AAA+ ATPase domain-containing protein n=2 Tax=root TaxID=1 RepID=A0A6N2YGG4_9FIRM|nr:ATP-binding protein [Coprobacillus cateniformis]
MYIKKICNENTGPIERVVIRPEFSASGEPKPILIVGENGSGKSTLISNIVDSFYELANKSYSDAMFDRDNYQGKQYFKAISGTEIRMGQDYMFSSIEFSESEGNIFYSFVSGELEQTDFNEKALIPEGIILTWSNKKHHKDINASNEQVERIFDQNILCYFGPDRYDKPQWMGKSYFNTGYEDYFHPSIEKRFAGEIANPIQEKDRLIKTLQWLLDVIADSRPDIAFSDNGINLEHVEDTNDLKLLGIARKNVETIMSEILGKDIFFGLNYRSVVGSRFNIRDAKSGEIIVPTLDSLSTGQSALFNIFATIVRYADRVDINKSVRLEDIQGIIVIDEVDLHLHTVLQKEVLPKLFKLFPKVQFIISTHSPLFILGMNDIYGEDNLSIVQMPHGTIIEPESFSEFQNAYQYMLDTKTHQGEIEKILSNESDNVLVLTEGATDWRHIKAAWNHLKDEDDYKDLKFELIEYDSKDGTELPKIDMSSSDLVNTCKYLCNIPRNNKLILIADADVPKDMKKMMEDDKNYKDWGNNVYSIVLPVPQHRNKDSLICIEHYYKDDDLKKHIEIRGVKRRIYMGCEFDSSGLSISESPRLLCSDKNSCGENKINIIDGQEKKSVKDTTLPEEKRVNLALSKMAFAKQVLSPTIEAFKNIDFEAFRLLFNVMKEIIEM